MQDELSLLTGSTQRILREFKQLGIPTKIINGRLNLISYKNKFGKWKSLKGLVSEDLPLFSKEICDDKYWTNLLFQELAVPKPETMMPNSDDDAAVFIKTVEKLVVKPRHGAHGHGVQLNIDSLPRLKTAIKKARAFDNDILLQEQIEGIDLRILVVGGNIISALERRPALVVGDGKHTVGELIDKENQRKDRGIAGRDALIKISLPAVKNYLKKRAFNDIPASGKEVRVVGPANHSMGGSVHDAMHLLTPQIRKQTVLLTNHLNMPIAGVDCLIAGKNHYFLELNASPGIGIHDDNFAGVTSGCFKTYAEQLYNNK